MLGSCGTTNLEEVLKDDEVVVEARGFSVNILGRLLMGFRFRPLNSSFLRLTNFLTSIFFSSFSADAVSFPKILKYM